MWLFDIKKCSTLKGSCLTTNQALIIFSFWRAKDFILGSKPTSSSKDRQYEHAVWWTEGVPKKCIILLGLLGQLHEIVCWHADWEGWVFRPTAKNRVAQCRFAKRKLCNISCGREDYLVYTQCKWLVKFTKSIFSFKFALSVMDWRPAQCALLLCQDQLQSCGGPVFDKVCLETWTNVWVFYIVFVVSTAQPI